jgi:hypothetical protein
MSRAAPAASAPPRALPPDQPASRILPPRSSTPPPAPPADPQSEPEQQEAETGGFESFSRRRSSGPAATAERRKRLLDALREKPRSVKALEHVLGAAPHQVANDLLVLKRDGQVEPTTQSAHDWPGANRSGKASKVYRIPVSEAADRVGIDGPDRGPIFWRCSKCQFDRNPDSRGWCDKCQAKRSGEVGLYAPLPAPTSDSAASDEGAKEEPSSQPEPTWLCGRCGNGGNLTGVCGRCGAPASERGPFTPPPGIPARDAAEQLAAASARLDWDATPIRVPDGTGAMAEALNGRGGGVEPEVAAARAIVAALDGLTPHEREKALHLALGARESAARLARYRMGVEAIELALPLGYPDLKTLVERVLQDDPH